MKAIGWEKSDPMCALGKVRMLIPCTSYAIFVYTRHHSANSTVGLEWNYRPRVKTYNPSKEFSLQCKYYRCIKLCRPNLDWNHTGLHAPPPPPHTCLYIRGGSRRGSLGGGTVMLGLFLVFVKPIFFRGLGGGHVPLVLPLDPRLYIHARTPPPPTHPHFFQIVPLTLGFKSFRIEHPQGECTQSLVWERYSTAILGSISRCMNPHMFYITHLPTPPNDPTESI